MQNFVGVVEDIFDPEHLGRVRVRIIGVHTEDKTLVATADLPWATVMTPTTSPSISGLGETPYLMMGSWVVGFFHDEAMQDPIIIGSIPGKPGEKRDKSKGFTDPSGTFPKWVDDSDLSYVSREEKFEESTSYKTKLKNRIEGLSKAVPAKIPTVAPDKYDEYYERKFMDEPAPSAGNRPEYPFNHTYETQSGHVEEFDDTPENLRYHRYHPAGSYEEIVNDGSRTIKIIGKDHEFVMKGKDVYINGDMNIIVSGDMTHYVQRDYHLEVLGDYTVNVHGSLQQKIGGNQETEVVRTRATSVGIDDNLYVTMNRNITVASGNQRTTVSGGNITNVAAKNITNSALLNATYVGGKNVTLTGGLGVNIAGASIEMHAVGNIIATTGGVIMLN